MKVVAKRTETKSGEKKKIYFQTLKGHVCDSLKILRCYLEKNEEVMKSFCRKWEIQPEIFMKSLFITIYLHDIGKTTGQFQRAILKNKRTQMYPHPFFGFPIVLELFKTKVTPIYFQDEYPLIEPLAVLSHHTQLHESIYRDASIRTVDLPERKVLEFINNMQKVYTELDFEEFFEMNWEKCENLLSINLIKNSDAVERILGLIYPKYKTPSIMDNLASIKTLDEMIRIKSIFTLFLSIMKLCDFYSSAHFSEFCSEHRPVQKILESVLDAPQKYVHTLPELSLSTILEGNSPYPFQFHIFKEATPYSFLFAPCGRGKTEAALLWALKICKNNNKNKIIFAMPTQTTSNALMDRFIKKIDEIGLPGKDLVGLYHGKAFVKLKEELRKEKEIDELTEDDVEEIKSDKFKGNIFFKPITVTTIDHLILSFVHGFRHADFACGNLQNAVIIFDEIHYYELQTLKHLTDLFVILQKMEIPHLLMSGTLPEFIKHHIVHSSYEPYSLIQDEEGLSFTPFKIECSDCSLLRNGETNTQVVQEIQDNHSKGLNQFIILNTVRRAQQFYDALSEKIEKDSIYLIHSQFTHADRAVKEAELIRLLCKKKKRPFIVVSTQVIEISLDISCDIMYTELAPIDSLGQRGGRLHRQGKTWKANSHEFVMKVFVPENNLPYDEDILERTAVTLQEGIHSYGSLKKVCDAVYGREYLQNFENEGELEGAFCLLKFGGKDSLFKKSFLFGPKYNTISFSEEEGNHFVIRTTTYRKFDVIPGLYYKNKSENLTVENQAKVPYWWVWVDRKIHGDELQWFEVIEQQFKYKKKVHFICNLPYSSDYGFDSSVLEKENSETGIMENIF